jgi:hypothetical protein
MAIILSIMMLAVIAMIAGAVALGRRGGSPRQIALMLLVAAIMLANVLLWALPLPGN